MCGRSLICYGGLLFSNNLQPRYSAMNISLVPTNNLNQIQCVGFWRKGHSLRHRNFADCACHVWEVPAVAAGASWVYHIGVSVKGGHEAPILIQNPFDYQQAWLPPNRTFLPLLHQWTTLISGCHLTPKHPTIFNAELILDQLNAMKTEIDQLMNQMQINYEETINTFSMLTA